LPYKTADTARLTVLWRRLL